MIGGCVQQYGEQMFNVTRNAWLQAGLPMETPATTVDRQCGSAQQAVNFAAALIAAGVHDVVIGGGVEHMGHIPMGVGFKWTDDVGSPWPPELLERYELVPQGLSARDDRRQVGAARGTSSTSSRCARTSSRTGRPRRAASSARSIPFAVNGDTYVSDQGIRPGHDAGGAGRAQARVQARRQGDGRQLVADLRRRRRGAADVGRQGARARRHAAREDRRPDDGRRRPGDDAHRADPGDAASCCERNGMTIDDIDLFEVNEAFAPGRARLVARARGPTWTA